jgi:selenide, water dikinase
VKARIDWSALPVLPGAVEFAREGFSTGASGRNLAGYGDKVTFGSTIDEARKALLTDPQTSGGLLVSCAPGNVEEVLSLFRADGFGQAVVIGDIEAGDPQVRVG